MNTYAAHITRRHHQGEPTEEVQTVAEHLQQPEHDRAGENLTAVRVPRKHQIGLAGIKSSILGLMRKKQSERSENIIILQDPEKKN